MLLLLVAVHDWFDEQQEEGFTQTDIPCLSIVVIARNEQQNIAACLSSIYKSAQTYQHEIILMDDHSEDATIAAAEHLGIPTLKILSLKNFDIDRFGDAFKKAGQYWAVKEARYDWILQTDADCIVPLEWAKTMISNRSHAALLCGPIHIEGDHSMLEMWQTFENMGTMLLTQLGQSRKWWINANGANMLYQKKGYLQYATEANFKLASGDDIFFAEWCARSHSIKYVKKKSAIVSTYAEKSLTALMRQRIRWATKTRGYQSSGLKIILGSLFLYHAFFLISIPLVIYQVMSWKIILIAFLIKWLADTILLKRAGAWFDKYYNIWTSVLFSIYHLFYVVWIGLAGLNLKRYSWKGRRVT